MMGRLPLWKQLLYFVVAPLVAAVCVWYLTAPDSPPLVCRHDYASGESVVVCRLACPPGHFSLPGMDACHKWLGCSDIESSDFEILEAIGSGAVKKVHRAVWRGHEVAYSHLLDPRFRADFRHGLSMLAKLQSPHVTQLIGHCRTKFVTAYHPLGSLDRLDAVLAAIPRHDSVATRFSLCVNYVRILHFLHNSPAGTRVMCDSNDLPKLLGQFLLTSDLGVVVNDLDALPLVNRSAGKLVTCGSRELYGDFVAPEQLWPHGAEAEFSAARQPGYDELTDVWKAPDVCDRLLGAATGADPVRFALFRVHNQCKQLKPQMRPTAAEILEEYTKVQEDYDLL